MERSLGGSPLLQEAEPLKGSVQEDLCAKPCSPIGGGNEPSRHPSQATQDKVQESPKGQAGRPEARSPLRHGVQRLALLSGPCFLNDGELGLLFKRNVKRRQTLASLE